MSRAYYHPVTGTKSYVPFHRDDTGSGLDRTYYSDPAKFVPSLSPESARYEYWGIAHEDMMASIMRTMDVQMIYMGNTKPERPERAFVKALMDRKAKSIASRDESARSDRVQRDFILHIHMPDLEKNGEVYIWRRIRVSGGVVLTVLQDKILQAVMGWERNYHAWLMTDHLDGSQFGLKASSHIDFMHMDKSGYECLDASTYTLADLLLQPGDTFSYMYDLGDHWEHIIRLEEIVPLDSSNGRVEVLDGAGACPPEDGSGNHHWQRRTLEKPTLDYHLEIARSSNYRDHRSVKELGRKWRFDPLRFDIGKAQARVQKALGSRSSLPLGGKSTVHVLRPDYSPHSSGFVPPGEREERKVRREGWGLGGMGSYSQETVRTMATADEDEKSLCENCGSPGTIEGKPLMRCGGCQRICYCSRECQRAQWKTHKKTCQAGA